MYIAMNRFKITPEKDAEFEAIWKARQSRLSEMNGFVEFRLLRGPQKEDHTLYATHTLWNTYEDFKNWTQSEQFRDAHKNAGGSRSVIMGHPEFEGFHTVLIDPSDAAAANAAE